MTPDELSRDGYQLLGEMTHATLAEFVIEYFLRRGSWLIWLHHAMSLMALAAAITAAAMQGRGVGRAFLDFGLSLVALFVVILPLHEALHAVAYRLVGARDIRWDYSMRMLAVWVIAHRFVVSTGPFLFVALAPFVVINMLLVAAAVAFPQYAVLLLFVLLVHLHGCAGDWSLLNFVWLHRRHGFWTYDDAVTGRSYFFGRGVR
jgi:Putative zincin peptidase